MIPTWVIIISLIGVIIILEKLIEKYLYKKVKVIPYVEQEEMIIDPKTKEYSVKTFFDVPGCGRFGSPKEATIGSRKCALDLEKEVGTKK